MRKRILCGAKAFDLLCRSIPSFGKFKPIRGSFSAYRNLIQNQISGQTIVESQIPDYCIRGSVTDLAKMNQNNHQPWPIFWVRADDARLVGRMLEWRNYEDYICYEGAYRNIDRRSLSEDHFFAQIIIDSPYPLDGAWTSIVSKWGNGGNYYHWIIDSLTRLLVREHLPEETRILIPANPPKFISETIEMLGFTDIAHEAPSNCIHPERFYFCSPTAMTGAWNPLGYEWLREKFSRYRNPCTSGSPIFLTRRAATRIPNNLKEIESLFEKNGFRIIDSGQLTVKKQIEITSSAPAIAGLHGAAMTNILWAKPNVPILEIFQPNYINGCYEQIARQGKLPYQFTILNNGSISEISLWIKQINE